MRSPISLEEDNPSSYMLQTALRIDEMRQHLPHADADDVVLTWPRLYAPTERDRRARVVHRLQEYVMALDMLAELMRSPVFRLWAPRDNTLARDVVLAPRTLKYAMISRVMRMTGIRVRLQ